jgi:hypothetical protein
MDGISLEALQATSKSTLLSEMNQRSVISDVRGVAFDVKLTVDHLWHVKIDTSLSGSPKEVSKTT